VTDHATRARVLGERLHDFYCRAKCIPSTQAQSTELNSEGWWFTWPCGYIAGVTADPDGLEAAERYWRQRA